MTAAELAHLLPTDDDVRFFRERGWYVSGTILSEEMIEDALYGIDRYYAGERDRTLPIRRGYLDWKPEHGDILRQNDYVSLQNDEIRDLVMTPVIGAIAARLAGATTVRLFHDQLIYKPPTGHAETAVGWHSDRAYWQTCTSQRMLTAWVPFVQTSERSGTLTMIDGSHRWSDVERFDTFTDHDMRALESQFESHGVPAARVPMELTPGQASFHHCRTLHGSFPNRSATPRIALAIHMQDETNAYQRRLDAKGDPILHVNDVLCRSDEHGTPDYTDPDICPVLWPAGAADR
jgi:ectoine hydroxylase-related dioxygenase (phytanoyl-CoA dioxygenase family)